MFRIVVEIKSNKDKPQHIDAVMKTEKFYEILGRYALKYGPHMLVEESHGATEFEYSREKDGNITHVSLTFAKVAETVQEKEKRKTAGPIPPKRSIVPMSNNWEPPVKQPQEPDDPRIAVFKEKGIVEDDYYYNRYGY
jgi:hypothetical protein